MHYKVNADLVPPSRLDPLSPLYAWLRPEPVARLVADHQAARADLSPQIWALLTLESWLRQDVRG